MSFKKKINILDMFIDKSKFKHSKNIYTLDSDLWIIMFIQYPNAEIGSMVNILTVKST